METWRPEMGGSRNRMGWEKSEVLGRPFKAPRTLGRSSDLIL